jgi:hypothetical protein
LIDSINIYRPKQISVDFILDFNVNKTDFD